MFYKPKKLDQTQEKIEKVGKINMEVDWNKSKFNMSIHQIENVHKVGENSTKMLSGFAYFRPQKMPIQCVQ